MEKNIQLKARINYLKKFYESKGNLPLEEIKREVSRSDLEQWIKNAERFYYGNKDIGLFLILGMEIFNKEFRIKLTEIQLTATEVHLRNIAPYSELPEFKDLINRYNNLSEKIKR